MGAEEKRFKERRGLFLNVPRGLRRDVEKRLAALEADPARLDRELVASRSRYKRVYALLHVKPGERAKASLFGRAPADSPLAALRALRTATDGAAAELVREHLLPYVVVEGARGGISEPVGLALVETMEDDEVLVRLPSLARVGLLTGPVRSAVLGRLHAMAGTAPAGLSYAKLEAIARRASLDGTMAEALFRVLRSEGRASALKGETAILVDASPSMAREGGCLELAARVAHRLDGALAEGAALTCVAFGSVARAVDVRRGRDLGVWRRALTIPAGELGQGSSAGSAAALLAERGVSVDRLVVVTDGYENRPPRLASALEAYAARTGRRPRVLLVQPGGGGVQLASDLRRARIVCDVFPLDAHGAGLDALVQFVGRHAAADVFTEIAEHPLPWWA